MKSNYHFKLILLLLFFYSANAQKKSKDSIDLFMEKYITQRQVPGCAIALLKNNTIVKMNGYGFASLEFNVPVTLKSKFLLDSETKLFTSFAMMKLQEQGKLKLDDPINQYLDSIPAAWQKATIRNLLTHSSGIHDDYVPYYHSASLMEYTNDELYGYALQQPLDFQPGTRTKYNNLGFFLATILIEKVTHTSYPKFMTDSFFAPLGLKDISFAPQDAVVKDYATPYTIRHDSIVRMRDYAVSQQGFSYMMKASVQDLAKFDQLLNDGKVISRESIAEMRKPFITNDGIATFEDLYPMFEGIGYAINFIDGYTIYSKGGASGCLYMQIPARHLTLIIMANQGAGYYNSYELAAYLARFADHSLSNLGNFTPYQYQQVLQKFEAELLPNQPQKKQAVKDPHPELTKQMNQNFINFLSRKFDSGYINLRFTSGIPPGFFGDGKQMLQKLQTFTYAGEFQMHDNHLVLFGEHPERVIAYKVKIDNVDYTFFFYLSDKNRIVMVGPI